MPQLQTMPRPQTVVIEKPSTFDLIIVGGGPAGITAAIYALRAKLQVLLIEKMIIGGMASTTSLVENYPGFPQGISGPEISRLLQAQVQNLGLTVLWQTVTQIEKQKQLFKLTTDTTSLEAKSIIIASGTEAARLQVPGETQLRGRGVSYCATCDGPFYKDKNVFVVGGGNAAVEEAIYLTRFASKVSIIHRRDTLRADKVLVEKATSNPKIYFYWNAQLEEIHGQQKVESITIKENQTANRSKLAADGVFIYIGTRPNTGFIKDLVKTDKDGFIESDTEMKTNLAGIFAAGDIRKKSLRQIITAMNDGAIAAENARKFLES